ncbi:DUF6088 family protein [Paracnuella aquatica]|uniref:DUF6088 family protein n=1 Tax=Paracnuella aquatica TaxID=2268757 RepID=UPI000DEEBBB7|nr:DUF6088 family protein [Paracnuella aquatica]RPD47264.1 hypothetical protein DRJ53_12190 [Paracnuella aquatica]
MLESTHNQIVAEIKGSRRGKLVFPGDFQSAGSETAIRKTLSRLAQEGVLIRLAHGIYLYPKVDRELGILYPSAEEIAQAVAKRERVRIMPAGAYALHRLGLTTQVPTRIVYLTDGEAKNLKVGKFRIVFKPAVPKKLSAKGKLSGLVIQALQELKKEKVTSQVLRRLQEVLSGEDPEVIRSDAQLAPAWIAKILLSSIDAKKKP